MILYLHEIFDQFDALTTREQRIFHLRKHCNTIQYKDFFICAFNPNIKLIFDIPKYRPALEPEGLTYSYLHNEMDRIYLFIEGHPKTPAGLTEYKREGILKSMLESIHRREAELLIQMFKKKLEVKFLTPKIIIEAFPNIILA